MKWFNWFNFLKRIFVLTMLLGDIGAPVVEQVQPAQAATKTIKKVTKRQRKLLKKLRSRLTQAKSLRKLKFQQPKSISICLKAAITQQAMNAWNDTKAINFKQVIDYRKANIIANTGNYSNTGWAGITQLPAVPRGYLYGSIISLNNFFLDQVNPEIALSMLNTNWVTLLVWSTTTANHQLWILQWLINVLTPSNNVISML